MQKRRFVAVVAVLAAGCSGPGQVAQPPGVGSGAALVTMPVGTASAPTAPEPKPARTAHPEEKPPATANVLEAVRRAGRFTMLLDALDAAGLTGMLEGPGPYTLFAPNDDAFKKIPKDQRERLLKDKRALAEVLGYHLVSEKLTRRDLFQRVVSDHVRSIPTVAGKPLRISVGGDNVYVGSSDTVDMVTVGEAEIVASNGMIHEVNKVLLVPIPHPWR